MKKNILSKLVIAAYFALCANLLVVKVANAYIDPSTTTYLIQAVAGVAIAVGAAVTIYFRKAKKKVVEKLGIDENSQKEVEDEIIILDKEGK